ncbi:MAG: hypothetical protein L6R38_003618 [Xanthoria sp. 2 TBL-2021]|nr:MAG: hypothetical protein L6R38_003618 [Xanthoria sp. 2 TBL-2021]
MGLTEFDLDTIPQYAILSHTWGPQEVSFQEMQTFIMTGQPPSEGHLGFEKIKRCCDLARYQQYSYLWIDTCCIDKKSSAELSEAINSMYSWYAKSAICYAYLTDYTGGTRKFGLEQTFENSRWFRRGWTLQELLAPDRLLFYDRDWRFLGNKHDLVTQISAASGIEERYIKDRGLVYKASIATRMSWACKRQTARPEDEGYCLMGLFRVHMPLLYGEGRNAFLRLQYEIARHSNDESLFAWHTSDPQSGIFATSPLNFARSGDFAPRTTPDLDRAPYTITNRGLAVDAEFRILPFRYLKPPVGCQFTSRALSYTYILLPLHCARKGSQDRPFTIILQSEYRHFFQTFVRLLPEEDHVYEKYFSLAGKPQRRVIYIQRYMDLRGDVEKRYSHQWLSPAVFGNDRKASDSTCTSRAGSVICSELQGDSPVDGDLSKLVITRQRPALPLSLYAHSNQRTLKTLAEPQETARTAQGELSHYCESVQSLARRPRAINPSSDCGLGWKRKQQLKISDRLEIPTAICTEVPGRNHGLNLRKVRAGW